VDEQRRAVAFADEHDLDAAPAYRILDLAAEVGEIAADAAKTSGYGADPEALDVSSDELGDALFALCLVADSQDVDLGAAFDEALAKYGERADDTGSVGSRGGE
jgi:NTP pyrophosphatase (non-canonical NTP hydrolase)